MGIFPFPAANLLLPTVASDHAEALAALMVGDLDTELPPEWEFFRDAARGDSASAIRRLQARTDASEVSSLISSFNLFVLKPSLRSYRELCQSLNGELRELLDVAAYVTGVVDSVPIDFSIDGEIAGLALATSAAAELERDATKNAQRLLRDAFSAAKDSSPILAATLLSQLADIAAALPGVPSDIVIKDYEEAIRLADKCKLPLLFSELHIKLAMLLQNTADGRRGRLLQAVNSYQAALQSGVTEEGHPELFAQIQNNLGLAYLSMPSNGASDQLRNGIAVQSFRHALKVYRPDKHPVMWASVSMNLANALQYAPSSHPEENLIQAVKTYDEVLQVRSREQDPVAYAMVLLNQANALAHLGIFKPALEKLAESYKLFQWYEQHPQADAARELVEQINQKIGERSDWVLHV